MIFTNLKKTQNGVKTDEVQKCEEEGESLLGTNNPLGSKRRHLKCTTFPLYPSEESFFCHRNSVLF